MALLCLLYNGSNTTNPLTTNLRPISHIFMNPANSNHPKDTYKHPPRPQETKYISTHQQLIIENIEPSLLTQCIFLPTFYYSWNVSICVIPYSLMKNVHLFELTQTIYLVTCTNLLTSIKVSIQNIHTKVRPLSPSHQQTWR